MLILAGVSINLVLGPNGLIAKAQEAALKTDRASLNEKIQMAIVSAQMEDNEYKELTAENLGSALIQDGTKAVVSENEDGTIHILFLEEKKEYRLNSDGNIEDLNIDFDAKYVAPESQDEERNNGVIGIGTDGKPVDMDLWLYTYDKSTNGYALNSEEALKNDDYGGSNQEKVLTCGYLGNVQETSGEIEGKVPAYISSDNGKTYVAVTSLYRTFQADCSNNLNLVNLKVAPILPVTITNMLKTFVSASNLEDMPIIPEGVTNMESTFYNCSNLNKVTLIPQNVLTLNCTFSKCSKLESGPEIKSKVLNNMYGTFEYCTSLIIAPEIPNSVVNMHKTFNGCTSLIKASKIPNSVTVLIATFKGCSNLQGTIEINANVTGKQLGEEFYNNIDYMNCLYDATTNSGLTLKVTGSCPVLEQIVENANNPNITLE